MLNRCEWAGTEEIYINYHDKEWGVPVHDDRILFEFLILEGAQAGLSWITILKKRENYRIAFDNFDWEKIAKYDSAKIEELMQNAGIIRNRLKITATIKNAQAFIKIIEEYGTFDKYIWSFTGGKQITNKFEKLSDLPGKDEIAERMSKELKKRGFNFVGPTICYSFMQAVGMVNDHLISCFRYNEICDLKE